MDPEPRAHPALSPGPQGRSTHLRVRYRGLPAGTAGVIAAYDGLLHELIVDSADADDTERNWGPVQVRALPTRIGEAEAARALAEQIVKPR